MKLDQFVRESLEQISKGVADAGADNTNIAPRLGEGDNGPKTHRAMYGGAAVFLVDFDVAVTVSDAVGADGGEGITVVSPATLKTEKDNKSEAAAVSRLKFSVPVSYG
jgi:hypothetical protein